MLKAFCRVAPSVRLSFFAIFPAFVFFRASVFSVRTSVADHARLFRSFLHDVSSPNFEMVALIAKDICLSKRFLMRPLKGSFGGDKQLPEQIHNTSP
jgi:hypothetical protein